MRETTVAIITRTKNRPILLERSIKSVLAQTFTDYILVIVNDGGDAQDVDRLVEKYNDRLKGRVFTVHNKDSLGMEAASNKAIKATGSKYIASLDDDDTWHKDFLKNTTSFLENSSFKGVVTGSIIVQEIIQGESVKTVGKTSFAPEINTFTLFSVSGLNKFPNNSFVYERAVIDKIGDYDKEAPVLGDWDFNTRFLRHFDIGFIDKPLANYHQRTQAEGHLSNSINNNGHVGFTSGILNDALRKDLNNGKLELGFIANLSHEMQAARTDAKKDRIHQTLMLEDIQKTLEHQNQRLSLIESELHRMGHLEQRVKNYVKRLPHRVAKKALKNEPRKK